MLLDPIPDVLQAFCKYVHLNNKRFESDFPIYIQLTITWRNQTLKKGAVVWSENVTTSGFTTCVLVGGWWFSKRMPTPTVFWIAYQKGLMDSSVGLLVGGSINIPSWSSGSKCQRLPGISSFLVNYFVHLVFLFGKILVIFIIRNFLEFKPLVSGMR